MLTTLSEKVHPTHAALIVTDVQNEFCDDSGAFGRIGRDVSVIRSMVPNLLELIEAAREAGVLVIFLRYSQAETTESEVQLEQRNRGRAGFVVCREGTWGAEFYRVTPKPGEPIVVKRRYSGFVATDLDLILRSHGIKTIVMTGIATNGCVEATARDGFMHDYYVVLVDDCCSCYSPELHNATIQNINDAYGITTTWADVAKCWTKASL